MWKVKGKLKADKSLSERKQLPGGLHLLVVKQPGSAPSCSEAPRNEEGIKKGQVSCAMASFILPLFWKKLFPVYPQAQ